MALLTAKTLFVHVPKTGGSSVRAMLPAAGVKAWESGPFAIEDHYGLPELKAAHPGIDAGRLTFGFVRHPVAWLRSRWAWAVVSRFPDKVSREPAAAAHWMASCWSDEFEEFALRYLERFPGVYTQTVFRALGLWTSCPVARVGRTELLAADLSRILEEAGEEFDRVALDRCPREKVAASGKLAKQTKLPGHIERAVMRAENDICVRFGY